MAFTQQQMAVIGQNVCQLVFPKIRNSGKDSVSVQTLITDNINRVLKTKNDGRLLLSVTGKRGALFNDTSMLEKEVPGVNEAHFLIDENFFYRVMMSGGKCYTIPFSNLVFVIEVGIMKPDMISFNEYLKCHKKFPGIVNFKISSGGVH